MGTWHTFITRPPGQFENETVECRGYYRDSLLDKALHSPTRMLYLADFIYTVGDNKIIKNRTSSVEALYEKAAMFDRLKYHSNEQVRKQFERVLLLAELSNDPERDW